MFHGIRKLKLREISNESDDVQIKNLPSHRGFITLLYECLTMKLLDLGFLTDFF